MDRKDGKPKVYTKADKTKRKIVRAFLELLDHKPLDSVTIQEICDLAGIHRTTFYKHFGSVFDVIDALSDEITSALSDVLSVVDTKEKWFDFLAEFITEYRKALQNLNKTKYKEMVISPLAVVLYEFYYKLCYQERKNKPDNFKIEWLIRYHVAGTLAVAEHWLGEKFTKEQCRASIEGLYNMVFK